ncbi:MAG: type I-E CRISPR-associated protein Cas5/CasD [Eubacteriales bacterium]|nr:type I-E CRISPR-associated protein Cas5/CasD [Eubacteriales bacterium]
MPRILILRLEGVLQSWGLRSRWSSRDSGLFPTKSGIVGLLGCALGYERGDERVPALQSSLRLAVRADKPGRLLWDYQTVTRYGANLVAATGKPRTMPGTKRDVYHLDVLEKQGEKPAGRIQDTIISRRQYLQDASFTAFLVGPEEVLDECAQALQSPRWQIYLGRKSCPPCLPVFENLTEEYASLEEALRRYPLRPGAQFPVLCEVDSPGGGILRQDLLKAGGTGYAYRRLDTLSLKGGA